ncbi:M3 family metallopeptidase [Sutterella sp.]|uniref:M3 family metallopeptidase n=1 Tax=Sutterella sp. TaxID=1981025 RepID=UPI0026DF3187|nr:M3 family metallopeptidase [Sutterella sp.]MDO5531314.1 M3 family metallopeptidase [Sutterella sp.]
MTTPNNASDAEAVNPLLTITDLIDYAAIRPEHVVPAVKALCSDVEKTLAAVTAPGTPADWEHVVEPLEEATIAFSRAWGAVGHLQGVMNTPALREAFNEALPLATDLYLSISQNEALYGKYRAIAENSDFANLPPVRQRIVKRELRDFELSGAALPPAERERVKEIGQESSITMQKFGENVLDATNAFELVLPDDSRLKGLPEETLALYRESAKTAGKEGYRITLQFPSYLPAMKYCEDREIRETLYRAFATRASELSNDGKFDNTELITKLLKLRAEEAKLLGYRNYGELSLVTKMAESPEEVLVFLRDLAARSRKRALADAAEVDQYAHEVLGIETVEAWDRPFAAEKLREARYSYSDAEVKRYFTQNAVFAGLFKLVETLFGIEITEATAPVWHPDVKYFEVRRAGEKIAAFYADLYAREGKRSGAWMDGERTRRRLPSGELVTPIAYLVTNFAAPVEGAEATMTHDEVTTLFHEFGHTLHHILTAQEEPQVSGINGVEWDAVELPSQFLENFAWERAVVKSISKHAVSGEPLPDELFDKMIAAKNYEAGAFCVRQVEFALFDMLIHTEFDPAKDDMLGLLNAVRKEVAVVFPPAWNRFPQSFGHIFAGGYAAGYYSYKWAEVLSADCFSAFEETGVLNPETGRRYLTEILERGSSRDAIENFVAFRGRKPELDPLLRLTGIVEA